MDSIMDASRLAQMADGSPAPMMNWLSRATCSSVAVWVAKNSSRSTSIGPTSGGASASAGSSPGESAVYAGSPSDGAVASAGASSGGVVSSVGRPSSHHQSSPFRSTGSFTLTS
jgi:hypothetical protein